MTSDTQIPISQIGDSYYLFHAPSIAHIRKVHRIPGLLTGTLPQASQQNVFYGLPLQLMTEEARILVEKGVAFIVDDAQYHRKFIHELERKGNDQSEVKARWLQALQDLGTAIAEELEVKREAEKSKAIGQMSEKAQKKKEGRARNKESRALQSAQQPPSDSLGSPTGQKSDDEGLESILAHQRFFSTISLDRPRDTSATTPSPAIVSTLEPHTLTPTISHPPIPSPAPPLASSIDKLPPAPVSYPLFRHLHSKDYFLSPGLRFGCQYMAYPGDPLRFHSHFMVVGRDWDEEVDLMSLVGLGRLGTGVKKGVLVGGIEPAGIARKHEDFEDVEDQERVRCFCIEWGGL